MNLQALALAMGVGSPVNIQPDESLVAVEKALLGPNGQPQVVDTNVLRQFTDNQRALFCHKRAIYQLATSELIAFLTAFVRAGKAIEIGAGEGTVGRALAITLTDSRVQETPEIVAKYKALGQPAVTYPADIVKMTAAEAVAHYKPKVVVGCWVTQLLKEDPFLTPRGSLYGVDEVRMMTTGFGGHRPDLYIMVGNLSTHGDKEMLNDKRLHVETLTAPWLYSRSLNTAGNVIYIVRKK